jgi:hypothetical protein
VKEAALEMEAWDDLPVEEAIGQTLEPLLPSPFSSMVYSHCKGSSKRVAKTDVAKFE